MTTLSGRKIDRDTPIGLFYILSILIFSRNDRSSCIRRMASSSNSLIPLLLMILTSCGLPYLSIFAPISTCFAFLESQSCICYEQEIAFPSLQRSGIINEVWVFLLRTVNGSSFFCAFYLYGNCFCSCRSRQFLRFLF